jgi:UDPglucose 6-dehydrogenase
VKVAVIGTGYVGLVSGACFADFGHYVVCVDKSSEKIESLNRGITPILEPGLTELVASNVKDKRLAFTTSLSEAMIDADVALIAVGTPSRRGDGHADLCYVYAAAAEIARLLSSYTVVVVKSTESFARLVPMQIFRLLPTRNFSARARRFGTSSILIVL